MPNDFEKAMSAIAAYEAGPYTASDVFMECHLETIKLALTQAIALQKGESVIVEPENLFAVDGKQWAEGYVAAPKTGEQS